MSSSKEKTGGFLLHGGILAAASIIVRLIGMIYRIPMVNIIGSEGSGYYANAYSIYNILLLLSSYSLPLSVSKMVSARLTVHKWKETKRVFVTAIVFAGTVGILFSLITLFGADFFCSVIIKSPKSALALKCLAPTVLVMSFLGVLRGFFQGHETMIPTALSQILEQIVNAFVSVGMAAILFHAGMEAVVDGTAEKLAASFGAAGGTIGTGAGALTALVFFIILYVKYRPGFLSRAAKDKRKNPAPYGKLLHILTMTAVPVILSTAVFNAVELIDAALFNNAMAVRGIEERVYTSTWGDYNNAFLLLIHLPVAVSSAIGSALVPSLSAAYARHDHDTVRQKTSLAIRVTLLFAIPVALGEMAIGGSLAKLLFSGLGDQAPLFLTVGGFSVIAFSLSTVTNAILQGINRMKIPVVHAFLSLVGHAGLAALLLFVFKADIFAVIVSYMLFGTAIAVMNLIVTMRLTGFSLKPVRSILFPFVASFFMVLICLLISFLFS
ncbi:MAG: polysaccharide biosynthesis protein, partial [Lachnospiraceae bacterium]|nr:polysaccharide biosynthesis protein [Lachnospiraceae bacterium]